MTALVVPQDQPFDVFECQWCDHVFADLNVSLRVFHLEKILGSGELTGQRKISM